MLDLAKPIGSLFSTNYSKSIDNVLNGLQGLIYAIDCATTEVQNEQLDD